MCEVNTTVTLNNGFWISEYECLGNDTEISSYTKKVDIIKFSLYNSSSGFITISIACAWL